MKTFTLICIAAMFCFASAMCHELSLQASYHFNTALYQDFRTMGAVMLSLVALSLVSGFIIRDK